MSIIPKSFAIQLKDNNGNFVSYLENKIDVANLSWEWNRIGGCGAANLLIRENWDAAIVGSFTEDYEVNIYAPVLNGTAELWYAGYIDRSSPIASGKDEYINTFCLGYINQLKKVIVRDRIYQGMEISNIVKDIIDIYVTPITRITSTASDYDDTGFIADYLYFNENAYDCISKLADIAGKREWGVRADKSFFFKKRNDAITRWLNITEDFTSFNPEIDFNPMINKIYLIGGEGYNGIFSVVNRKSTKEDIVSNSSIISQSVGQQYARMYLKEHGIPKRSYSGELVQYNQRIESIIPIGKAAIFERVGIKNRYDSGAKYDNGIKYDGGTESYQIERIKYTMMDDGIKINLNLGPVTPNIADELAKLEYMITTERNK